MALRRFSDNPAADLPLDGTETIPALQAGSDVQVTVQDIIDAASGAVTSVNGATGAVVLALDDLDDVDAGSPSDGDVLTWVAANSAWEPAAGGSGGSDSYTIVTEASAFTADPGTHDGLTRYIRAGGDVTFDDAEPYTAGMVFNIKATAALELVEDGVTLTPTYGGTLNLESGMGV